MLPNSHNHNNMVADYYLNRLQILSNLSYTSEIIGIPILTAADIDIVPNRLVAFSKAMTSKCYDAMIHFYESDKSFVRILRACLKTIVNGSEFPESNYHSSHHEHFIGRICCFLVISA